MTVSSELSKQTFLCDGTSREFVCPFGVIDSAELQGYLITISTGASSALVNGVDYTVANVGEANAVATTAVAYSSLYQVKFLRRTDRLQLVDYRDNDPFPAESHEQALDRLTHITQEQDALLDRSLRLPEPDTAADLPSAADRASKVLAFDASGDPVCIPGVDSSSAAALALDLVDGTSQTKGSYLVAWLWTATSAVARRVRDKLREIGHITPEDFGATGVAPGGTVTDQTAALTAFINSAIANPGVKHVVPRKWYGYSAALPTIDTSSVWIEGSGIGLHNVGTLTPHSCFVWVGGTSAAVGLTIEPDAGASNQYLTGLRITGLNFSGDSDLAKNLVIRSVRSSRIEVGSYNATDTGITLGALASSSLGENECLQTNDIDIVARQIEAPNGVPLRLQGTATANVSLNRFGFVDIIHTDVTGIIEENADNNVWEVLRLYCTGSATYSVEWLGGASEPVSCRAETFVKFTANKPICARGTSSYTYPSTNNVIMSLDTENATPEPVYETGATGVWEDTRGVIGGATAGVTSIRASFGEAVTNAVAGRARLGSTGSLHIVNSSDDHVQLSNADNTARWGWNIDSSGNLRTTRAAGSGRYQDTLACYGDYANDAAAAAGGVAVGQRYRNGSVMMIRVS